MLSPNELPDAPTAAIDIGTNTVLLTIARVTQRLVEPEKALAGLSALTTRRRTPTIPHLQVLEEHHRVTRLGQNVDRDRKLHPDAVARTLRCLEDFKQACNGAGVRDILCVGTSALRDASGGDAFRRAAASILGCRVQAITGTDEARLTFLGGISDLEHATAGPPDDTTQVLVFDIGGGSTEIALGSANGTVEWSRSMNVGSVRLTERYGSDLAAARKEITRQLSLLDPTAAPRPRRPLVVLGLAGTVTTLWALAHEVKHYSPGTLAGATLNIAEVVSWTDHLAQLTQGQRQALPGMEPGRADVIACGALICELIMREFGIESISVSDRGVRHGLLLCGQAPPTSA